MLLILGWPACPDVRWSRHASIKGKLSEFLPWTVLPHYVASMQLMQTILWFYIFLLINFIFLFVQHWASSCYPQNRLQSNPLRHQHLINESTLKGLVFARWQAQHVQYNLLSVCYYVLPSLPQGVALNSRDKKITVATWIWAAAGKRFNLRLQKV